MAYDRGTPHQLCQFHLLREYKRNIRERGVLGCQALLESDDMDQARECAGRVVPLTGIKALYWCVKALRKGLTHLRQARLDTARHGYWSGSTGRYEPTSGWVLCGQSTICQCCCNYGAVAFPFRWFISNMHPSPLRRFADGTSLRTGNPSRRVYS